MAINDHRIKIRPKPGQEAIVYGANATTYTQAGIPFDFAPMMPTSGITFADENPMQFLYKAGGLIFPYTPQVTMQGDVQYGEGGLTHVNQDYAYYTKTSTQKFSISGTFTAQNSYESAYLAGVLHFLRSNTKMRFGMNDDLSGLPPPVLLLDGYGNFVFNSLPVVIQTWSMDYSPDVDIVKVTLGEIEAYVPARTTVSLQLMVQNTPRQWLEDFNLDKFRRGDYAKNRNGGFF